MNQHYKRRIQRLLRMIVEIKTEPNLTVAQLRSKLGISKTQFYKDRATLAEVGFSFEYSRIDHKFVVTRDIALPVENFTLSEKLSLVMALRHLSASGDHVLTYEGFKAAKKIAASIPLPLRAHLFDDLVVKEGFNTESLILERLQQAINDNWQVALTYKKPTQKAPSIEVMNPYTIFFKRRAIYVEGYSWNERDIRVYRISRISEVNFKSKGFTVRPDYDFGNRYRNAFSAFPGETTHHVEVRFDASTRPYIEESTWHHSQKITPLPDGGIRFEVDVAEPREVMWWSFFWGAGAEILAPKWLREAAREEASRMADIYSQGSVQIAPSD